MKYLVVMFFIYSIPSYANQLSKYEKHYEKMNQLKGELAELELEAQIQKMQLEIQKSKLELKQNARSAAPPIPSTSPPPMIIPGFDPSDASVLYILGDGPGRSAVIQYNNENHTLRSGQFFEGWRVKILDKHVIFSNGSKTIQK